MSLLDSSINFLSFKRHAADFFLIKFKMYIN